MIAVVLILTLLLPLSGLTTFSQTPEPVVASIAADTETEHDFPRGMTFRATLELPHNATVDYVYLAFRAAAQDTQTIARVDPGNLQEHADSTIDVELFVDMQTQFIPMGLTLSYHWEVVTTGGERLQSNEADAAWFDSRFDWHNVSTDHVHVFYHDVSDAYARDVLEAAHQKVLNLEERYQLEQSRPVSIWIYANASEFHQTQPPNTRESIAGVSFPAYDVIAAVLPDGNQREVGRVILHEISHHVLNQAVANPFTVPPLWFDEGMAVMHQTGGTDQYMAMVIRAHNDDRLFHIRSLTTSFPFQPQQATLAYAASWTMLTYISEKYGDDGIAALIDAFGQGVSSDEAIQMALGISLDQLDTDWKAWIEQQTTSAFKLAA